MNKNENVPASVVVSPGATSVAVGETLQLTATVTDTSGQSLKGHTVTWTTNRPSVATVSSSGNVTGVAPGAVTITAAAAGLNGTAEMIVEGARVVQPYLTRKAQTRLDKTSVVLVQEDGRWILERDGQPDRDLGENFGRAKEALLLLVASERAATDGAVDRWLPEAPMTPTEFGDLIQLSTVLANESLTFFGGMQPYVTQRDRRAFVRTFFAAVEALVWTLRRLALSRHYSGQYTFAPEVLGVLRDEVYQLDDDGQVTRRELRAGFEKSVLHVLRACADAYGVEVSLSRRDVSWRAFSSIVKLRDRLTHPKKLSDIDIADSELDQLRATHQWFWTVTIGLMNTIAAAHNQKWL